MDIVAPVASQEIGANNPPTELNALDARLDQLEEAYHYVPPAVVNAEEAEKFTDAIRQIDVALDKLEEAKKAEKAPLVELQREIQERYVVRSAVLAGIVVQMRERLAKWMKANDVPQVRAEHGAIATLKDGAHEPRIDLDKVNWAAIGPYLSTDDIVRAVKKAHAAGVTFGWAPLKRPKILQIR